MCADSKMPCTSTPYVPRQHNKRQIRMVHTFSAQLWDFHGREGPHRHQNCKSQCTMSFLQLPATKHFLSTVQVSECVIISKDKLTDSQQCHRNKIHASNSGDMTAICLQTRSTTLLYLQRIWDFPCQETVYSDTWSSHTIMAQEAGNRFQKIWHKNRRQY
jgi:hypothetical protein